MTANITSALIAAGLFFLVCTAVFIGLVSRSVTKPLAEAIELVSHVAEGDLTFKATISSRDELGTMLTALNEMIDRLRNTVRMVTHASVKVSSGSEQMNTTAKQLSEGSGTQAAAAAQTTGVHDGNDGRHSAERR